MNIEHEGTDAVRFPDPFVSTNHSSVPSLGAQAFVSCVVFSNEKEKEKEKAFFVVRENTLVLEVSLHVSY